MEMFSIPLKGVSSVVGVLPPTRTLLLGNWRVGDNTDLCPEQSAISPAGGPLGL